MIQIPDPGDGFFAPAGGVRYVLTFEELCITGKTTQEAVEQWMLARLGRFDVRAIGVDQLLDVRSEKRHPGTMPEYRARAWAVTMHTPWHVYTITAPGTLGFWRGLEEVCRTIDREMIARQEAVDMRKEGSPT